ncbi:THO complex subunit 3 isoform X1 [Cinnamomum micranthum f. kanehirae]|uniref:THO complex subunit 3 isoform X1 n=1 Tax=Cinnamomum micranthum f. kanehirae TaxID=337451 RepID=A0A443NCB4_9MAGN|nr:THO complex subunit 3 isoform X1 [Cinnamomum micranthum f. kanehirae]
MESFVLECILCCQVNEIAWNTTGEIFFLTTGNAPKDNLFPFYVLDLNQEKLDPDSLQVIFHKLYFTWLKTTPQGLTCMANVGTLEVLDYPSLRVLHTLMAHTAGCLTKE